MTKDTIFYARTVAHAKRTCWLAVWETKWSAFAGITAIGCEVADVSECLLAGMPKSGGLLTPVVFEAQKRAI